MAEDQAGPGTLLVVFDFDWSFIDQDTDRWVCEVLSTKIRRKMEDARGGSTGEQCFPDVVYVQLCFGGMHELSGVG